MSGISSHTQFPKRINMSVILKQRPIESGNTKECCHSQGKKQNTEM